MRKLRGFCKSHDLCFLMVADDMSVHLQHVLCYQHSMPYTFLMSLAPGQCQLVFKRVD